MPDDKIAVQCPGCQAKFRAPAQFAGKKAKCPKCQGVIQIPVPKPPEPEPEPEPVPEPAPEPEPAAQEEAATEEPAEEQAEEEGTEEEAAEGGEEEEEAPAKAKAKASGRGGRQSRLAALRSRGGAKTRGRKAVAEESEKEEGAEEAPAPKKGKKGLLILLVILVLLLGGGAAAFFFAKEKILGLLGMGGGGTSTPSATSGPLPGGGSEEDAVRAVFDQFIAAYNAYNAAAIRELAVPDAPELAEIDQNMETSRQMQMRIEVTNIQVTVQGETATVTGEQRTTAMGQAGAPTPGQFTLRKRDGAWRMETLEPGATP